MVNITLEYRPFPFLKYTRKINGVFPSTFAELKPKQLIAIAGLVNQTISETDFLNIMTGITKFRIKRLDDYYRYQLMILFEPFTEIKPYDSFIIEDILTWTTLFDSPKPKLAGMTFGQFIFVESYFANFQTDKNPIDLHKFVASLYLPELHAFDEDKIPETGLMVAKVKPEILDAIVINYVLVKEWLAIAYPLVFQREDEDETAKPKKLNKSNNDSGWVKIFESIVGDDLIHQDLYSLLPVHTVLRWMSTKIKENMKRK
jgi:hypothetical protein